MKLKPLTGFFLFIIGLLGFSYIIMWLTGLKIGTSVFSYQIVPPSTFGSFYPVAKILTTYSLEVIVFALFILILRYYPKIKTVFLMFIAELVLILWTVKII